MKYLVCSKGTYQFSNTSTTCDECPEGFYCDLDSNVLKTIPCPIGHSCPSGSYEPVKCELGYYQNNPGQSSCYNCTAGYYCDDIQGTIDPKSCPMGSKCPVGSVAPVRCSVGTFQNLNGSSDCSTCPGGFFNKLFYFP